MAHRQIAELMRVPAPAHDLGWLQESLASAVQLELSTIPTYLTAYWSVKEGQVQNLILNIVLQEMFHMGQSANILTGIGGTPEINTDAPTYPGPLPGGVRPGLIVDIQGLTLDWLENVAMQIEYPESGPIVLYRGESYPTIGAFYTAIQEAIAALRPAFDTSKQLSASVAGNPVKVVSTPEEAIAAIQVIKEQGEGTQKSPDAGTELAHYYVFSEIWHGQSLVFNSSTGTWSYTGAPIPFPNVYPVSSVPENGYPDAPEEVQTTIEAFQATYTLLLDNLQAAWANTDPTALSNAILNMSGLQTPAIELMQTPIANTTGNYGPVWIYGGQ